MASKVYYTKDFGFTESKEGAKLYKQVHFSDQKIVTMKKSYFKKTYGLVNGNEPETELEEIWAKYNDYDTNPLSNQNDPGQTKLKKAKVKHTSMSVGDVVQQGREYYIVVSIGFAKIKFE